MGKKEKRPSKEFYTDRGYALQNQEHKGLTASMEDYLEMLYRLTGPDGYTRITDLASALNVQPPSASKMIRKLAEAHYVYFKKYGVIELTDSGRELGSYLLNRHQTIERFLEIIGVKVGLLTETEKIEHNVSPATVEKIMCLVEFFNENPPLVESFKAFLRKQNREPRP